MRKFDAAGKWEVNDTDVFSVVTLSGEYVCRIKNKSGYSNDVVTMIKPMLIVGDKNQQQFIPTVAATGEMGIEEAVMNADFVVTIVPTQEQYAQEYIRVTTGLHIPNGSIR